MDVVVKAEGFMEGIVPQVTLASSRDATDRLDIVLIPAARIEGQVLNEMGQPVPGAHVELMQYLYSVNVSTPDLSEEDRQRPEVQATIQQLFEQSNPNIWAKTDEQGSFVLTDVPQGRYPLQASRQDYFPVSKSMTIRPGQQLTDIQLVLSKRGGAIVVQVIDQQEVPLANHAVSIEGGRKTLSGTTDATGSWRAENLAPGSYRVSAQRPGASGLSSMTSQSAEAKVEAGAETQLVLQFIAGTIVAGDIDRASEPAVGIDVVVQQTGTAEEASQQASFGYATASTRTDAAGHFEFTDLATGSYVLAVGSEEEPVNLPFTLASTDQQRSFVIHLGTARLEGIVRDGSTGAPVEGAVVRPWHHRCHGRSTSR